MIDIAYANREFEKFLDEYDKEDDKIKLKIVHTRGVVKSASQIAQGMKLSKEDQDLAELIALLHDIGKAYIPKEILTKDGPLTEEEFEVMKTHTTIGYNVCMRDLKLRPYADGPLYHHEALNGSGYPSGLTQKDIPFVARIIRVADEYDALVTKRHYTTHVHISDTLKDLIKDTLPEDEKKIAALGQLSENSNVGKISPKILRTLCKLVIEDTIYEISIVCNYVDYLKENIKRLELIDSYSNKMQSAVTDKKRNYYKEGIEMLFLAGEDFQNYHDILGEYRQTLAQKEQRIDDLYNEIKIIKKLKV